MKTPRTVVVTGTNTEVGKTFVACALARAAVATGRCVVAIKPVESGCDLLSPDERDGSLLAAATGQSAPRRALQSLGLPVAPSLAANREGATLQFDDWIQRIRALGAGADLILVEGAGGLLSPLTDSVDNGDLAMALKAEVVLVAADRLGTLNHTLLTVEALARRSLSLCAVVLSAPATVDASTGSNGAVLRGHLDVPVIELPRCRPEQATGRLEGLASVLDMQDPSGFEDHPNS